MLIDPRSGSNLSRLVILGVFKCQISCISARKLLLDYIMLNTDRGADNYMIKYCEGDHEKTLVDVAPSHSVQLQMPIMSELKKSETASMTDARNTGASTSQLPAPQTLQVQDDYRKRPHIHIAAIDNSLSFPHEHPQGWRSYTYGWLYLPVSLIGRPFSEKTRNHFLPYLTSKTWWEETSYQLEKLFAIDPDFHPKMFQVDFLSTLIYLILFFGRNSLLSSKVHISSGLDYIDSVNK